MIYKATKGSLNTGVVSGTVTTTAVDDKATLLAKPFGKKAYHAVGTPVTLTPSAGVAPYSFNVTPTLATHAGEMIWRALDAISRASSTR